MIVDNVGAARGRPSRASRDTRRVATGRPCKRGRLLAVLTAASLLLTGCSALLERDYTSVTPHNAAPAIEGDPSILRADSYQELVNALIYLISSGMEAGTIRLYTDAENVEPFLSGACLEVVQEDPLGAYCVEFIKYSVDPVVTFFQAQVDITYRRTREQTASIVQATGTTAIRGELESALASFASERVLRISYFEEDEDFIQDLVRQAYYRTPACALGMPDVSVFIYPDSGLQRIVEILLDYPLEPTDLSERRDKVEQTLDLLVPDLEDLTGQPLALAAAQSLTEMGTCDPQGGVTAYDLFHSGSASAEGFSLALAALYQRLDQPCQVAQGEREGEAHFWNVIQTEEGWRHLDLSMEPRDDGPLYTDAQLLELGYAWNTDFLPPCA